MEVEAGEEEAGEGKEEAEAGEEVDGVEEALAEAGDGVVEERAVVGAGANRSFSSNDLIKMEYYNICYLMILYANISSGYNLICLFRYMFQYVDDSAAIVYCVRSK